ncbi:response regulator transcription factor [Streptomyces iakyrus]|uniref:Response regulator transcription factor n=1 Tax=Streptomyces iakyrus TaxID=68219 RepID=A0ABW8FR27_9ACTN
MLSADSDLEVVADASSGPQAEALAARLRPEIVMMDLRMPDSGGVDAIEWMARAGPACRVVVLTTYETDRDILRAVEAGAAGYLLGAADGQQHGKVGVDDRTAAVTSAMRFGLLEE